MASDKSWLIPVTTDQAIEAFSENIGDGLRQMAYHHKRIAQAAAKEEVQEHLKALTKRLELGLAKARGKLSVLRPKEAKTPEEFYYELLRTSRAGERMIPVWPAEVVQVQFIAPEPPRFASYGGSTIPVGEERLVISVAGAREYIACAAPDSDRLYLSICRAFADPAMIPALFIVEMGE